MKNYRFISVVCLFTLLSICSYGVDAGTNIEAVDITDVDGGEIRKATVGNLNIQLKAKGYCVDSQFDGEYEECKVTPVNTYTHKLELYIGDEIFRGYTFAISNLANMDSLTNVTRGDLSAILRGKERICTVLNLHFSFSPQYSGPRKYAFDGENPAKYIEKVIDNAFVGTSINIVDNKLKKINLSSPNEILESSIYIFNIPYMPVRYRGFRFVVDN